MSPWVPWLYQYGVGGLFFATYLILCLRSGAMRMHRRDDRILVACLVSGLLSFMTIHALWIYLAQ